MAKPATACRFAWKHRLAFAGAYPSFACHCEPVRTLVWQSASLQECLANWLMFGRIRSIFSYSPKVLLSEMLCCKENGLPRRYAPRNDMQRLAGCRRLQEPFLAAPWHHLLASATTHLSSACHCEPVRTLVWQSASPQKCLANRLMFGRIRRRLRIRPKYCFLRCCTARRTDCHVAALLAMTC